MTPASPLIHTNAMNEHHERMIEDPADLLGPGSRLESTAHSSADISLIQEIAAERFGYAARGRVSVRFSYT